MSKARTHRRSRAAGALGVASALVALTGTAVLATADAQPLPPSAAGHTASPIKHVVVIFDENISFDHYFGTYPKAANTDGTKFKAYPFTPKVNGLSPKLLNHNPNAYNPNRLTPEQALTCDQGHNYGAEQQAYNGGKMDKFVEFTGHDTCTGQPVLYGEPGLVMDYFDGNTVTAMWNYAQNYALNDNSFNANFGPSTPGAINLISGNTHGIHAVDPVTGAPVSDPYVVQSPDANGVGTMINDPDPAFDDCSDANHTSANNLGILDGPNVGDLLNRKNVTWGWFQGGFKPTGTANGYAVCGATHNNVGGQSQVDYSPHHEPFQYYKSTANPKHLPPSSVQAIGHQDQANHQYDLTDFDAAVSSGNLPAVSFLKAPQYQDGHAGYSDPLDEQQFVASEINKIQQSKDWYSTAVVVAYDDSDGWYDHVKAPIVNGSHDATQDTALCTAKPATNGFDDRCGYGPRTPLLVISPWSKFDHVDHTLTDQTSVLRFIEDNWGTGRLGGGSYDAKANSINSMFNFYFPTSPKVLLDPKTGKVTKFGWFL